MAKEKKFKIVYDRDLCIGAASCVALNPDDFELDDEGKAILKGGEKNLKTGLYEKIIFKDKKFELRKDACESCPVRALWIEEVKEEK